MVIIIVLLIVCLLICFKWYCDWVWRKKPIHNFPFTHRGKLFWYSRAITTTIGVFCFNKEQKLCVLANKRGYGVPNYQGYWNIVCGYLEHNVTGEENCQKEVYEETGLFIPTENIHFFGINTEPTEEKQNVSLRYISLLDGTCDEYEITNEYCEDNEVDDVKWIPIDEIEKYKWAFGHKKLIEKMSINFIKEI